MNAQREQTMRTGKRPYVKPMVIFATGEEPQGKIQTSTERSTGGQYGAGIS